MFSVPVAQKARRSHRRAASNRLIGFRKCRSGNCCLRLAPLSGPPWEFSYGRHCPHSASLSVGHTIFMITSNGKSLAFVGDLTHHSILLLEKPRTQFSYDTDPKQAAETWVRLLDMITTNKIPIMTYHYAWPRHRTHRQDRGRLPLLSRRDGLKPRMKTQNPRATFLSFFCKMLDRCLGHRPIQRVLPAVPFLLFHERDLSAARQRNDAMGQHATHAAPLKREFGSCYNPRSC
jgi:hypothetical protein